MTRVCRLVPLVCLWSCLAVQPAFACRYNVRETGFVDLGIDPYILYGYVSEDTPAQTISSFKQISQAALMETNIELEIIQTDRQENHPAIKYLDSASAKTFPSAVLVSPDGQSLAVTVTEPNRPFEQTLRSAINNILSSAKRDEILRQAAKTYGVVLLIEGPDAQQNERARKAASTVIEQVGSQLGMMPKPIAHPPELVVLEAKALSTEKMLLWSMDIDVADVNEPLAAVLYGRARWIGPLFKGEQISENTLAEVLFVIGADCECGFDYRWLLGTMLPAKWSRKLHEQAVESLGFDPESPMIKMEIGSIIRRGMGGYYHQGAPGGYQEIIIEPESDANTAHIPVEQVTHTAPSEPNVTRPTPQEPSPAGIYSILSTAAFLTIAAFVLVIILGIAILVRARRT